MPEFLRQQVGPITTKLEYDRLSAYFNIDKGGGRLFDVYTEGNAAAVDIFLQRIAPLKDLGVTTVSLRRSGSCEQDSLKQASMVEAIFLYSTALRDQTIPRKPLFGPPERHFITCRKIVVDGGIPRCYLCIDS